MTKKEYQKARMNVVNMECEQHLLAASTDGPVIMSGSSNNWSDLQ